MSQVVHLTREKNMVSLLKSFPGIAQISLENTLELGDKVDLAVEFELASLGGRAGGGFET
jgi:hypothetical protein